MVELQLRGCKSDASAMYVNVGARARRSAALGLGAGVLGALTDIYGTRTVYMVDQVEGI